MPGQFKNGEYEELLRRGANRYGKQWDPSQLSEQFKVFYHSRTRIKVRFGDMEVTGTVSATTGWRPSFLLVRRSSDHGSSWLLSDRDTIVAVKHPGDRSYRPVKQG